MVPSFKGSDKVFGLKVVTKSLLLETSVYLDPNLILKGVGSIHRRLFDVNIWVSCL